MSTDWKTTMKPNFTAELMALSAKELHQVMTRIHALVQDPKPDARVKKQLKHVNPRLHRIRCGDYRVLYTFEYPFISLLALRRRQEDTYDDVGVEFLGGFDPDLPTVEIPMPRSLGSVREDCFLVPTDPIQQLLPQPITSQLLSSLHIPSQYHVALLAIQSEDELLDCPGVPHYVLTRLLEHLFPCSLQAVMQEVDLVLQ
jgi:mRNA-degrading endonuclease RelE of RelBE toxin-antitoxin system